MSKKANGYSTKFGWEDVVTVSKDLTSGVLLCKEDMAPVTASKTVSASGGATKSSRD